MNTVTIINLWPRSFPCIGIHEHPCPGCYERHVCDQPCSREPDLEDDMQSGAYSLCEKCMAAGVQP